MPNWSNFRAAPAQTWGPYAGENLYSSDYYEGTPAPYVALPPPRQLAPAVPRSPDNTVPLPGTGSAMSQVLSYPRGAPGFGYSAAGDVPAVLPWDDIAGTGGYMSGSPEPGVPTTGNFRTPGSPGFGKDLTAPRGAGFVDAPVSPMLNPTGAGVTTEALKALVPLEAALLEWLAGRWLKLHPFYKDARYPGIPGMRMTVPKCNRSNAGFNFPCGWKWTLNTTCAAFSTGCCGLTGTAGVYAQFGSSKGTCVFPDNVIRFTAGWTRNPGYTGTPTTPPANYQRELARPVAALPPSLAPQLSTPVGDVKDDEEPIRWAAVPYLPRGLASFNPIEQTWRGPWPVAAPVPGRLAAPPGVIELYPVAGGVSVVPVPGVPPIVVPLPPRPVAVTGAVSIVGSFARPDRLFPRPPPPGTKERKPVPISRAMLRMIGHVTERRENLEAIWWALPKKCRSKPRPGRKKVEPRAMGRDVYECFGELDIGLAVWNLVTSELLDFVYGASSRAFRDNVFPGEGRSAQTGHSQLRSMRDNLPRAKKMPGSVDAPNMWIPHTTVDEVRRALTL